VRSRYDTTPQSKKVPAFESSRSLTGNSSRTLSIMSPRNGLLGTSQFLMTRLVSTFSKELSVVKVHVNRERRHRKEHIDFLSSSVLN
jgi:hypothetical protein